MKIILREEVPHLGVRGDVIQVKDGYARNFLLPKGKALRYSSGVEKVLKQEHRSWESKQNKLQGEAEAMASSIEGLTLEFERRVAEEDRIYGSVSIHDLSDALKGKGFDIERHRIGLDQPIKTLGTHTISIRLHPNVIPTITVTVQVEE